MRNNKPPAVPEKQDPQSAPKSVGLPLLDLKFPLGEFALKSRLNQLSATDLALVAASLNHGNGMSEDKAIGLVNDAWVLLRVAAGKMAYFPPQPPSKWPTLSEPAMSGARFLATNLGGTQQRRVERRREFYRLFVEKINGRQQQEISDRECDEWIPHFSTWKLEGSILKFAREIALELKNSPATARLTASRRRKGGLGAAKLRLIEELTLRGGRCKLDDLVSWTGFKKRTIQEVVNADSNTFEDEEVGPVREIRLRKLANFLESPSEAQNHARSR